MRIISDLTRQIIHCNRTRGDSIGGMWVMHRPLNQVCSISNY